MTNSLNQAIEETERRRKKQQDYNELNNITPQTIQKNISDILEGAFESVEPVLPEDDKESRLFGNNLKKYIKALEEKMKNAAGNLEFEDAAKLRDQIRSLQENELGLDSSNEVIK